MEGVGLQDLSKTQMKSVLRWIKEMQKLLIGNHAIESQSYISKQFLYTLLRQQSEAINTKDSVKALSFLKVEGLCGGSATYSCGKADLDI